MRYYCIKQHDITDCGVACLATICKQKLKWVKQIGICRFINLHICLLHKKVLF